MFTGKAVFCEKPLTLDSLSTKECFELSQANGKPLICGFNRLVVQFVKKVVDFIIYTLVILGCVWVAYPPPLSLTKSLFCFWPFHNSSGSNLNQSGNFEFGLHTFEILCTPLCRHTLTAYNPSYKPLKFQRGIFCICLLFCFIRRFDPTVRSIHDQVQRGTLGQIKSIKICSRDPEYPTGEYAKSSGKEVKY